VDRHSRARAASEGARGEAWESRRNRFQRLYCRRAETIRSITWNKFLVERSGVCRRRVCYCGWTASVIASNRVEERKGRRRDVEMRVTEHGSLVEPGCEAGGKERATGGVCRGRGLRRSGLAVCSLSKRPARGREPRGGEPGAAPHYREASFCDKSGTSPGCPGRT
jgi:hypothetical protein